MSDATYLAEKAEEAAELIKTKGWCQYKFTNGKGYCTVGAVMAATYDENRVFTRIRIYEKIEGLLNLRGTPAIAAWNDGPGRTKEEVIDLLMTVSKEFRNE